MSEGTDFRDDGLGWTVKTLWAMGVKVKVNDLSDKLNHRNKLTLVEKTKMEIVVTYLLECVRARKVEDDTLLLHNVNDHEDLDHW
eukprot:CAMPEP_0116929294 /NCGR_PEP_ID=MMETSP0467-20121206/26496_1 /TAXON_ID=283647 /ORGANISM="Mesodinium pulex, Strain SPMC105" /LENGTH=84 /DNA_ID=CAMNT_0004609237 /DNA_START=488 /DNA_END=739 /DNA_ORIENTATION=-